MGLVHGKEDSGQPWRGVDPTRKGRHCELPPDRALPKWFVHPAGRLIALSPCSDVRAGLRLGVGASQHSG
jgi:hypothetical protein